QDSQDVVSAAERNRDDIRNLIEEAKKNRQSLVAYLVDSQGSIMERVSGSRRDKLTDLTNKLATVEGGASGNLLSLISTRDAEISNLRDQLTRAESDRSRALTDLKNEGDRLAGIQASHQATVDRLNTDVGTFEGDMTAYRGGMEDYKGKVDAQVDRLKNENAEAQKRLNDEITRLSDENQILESQLKAARGLKTAALFRGAEESALVDGQVIGLDSSSGTLFLDIGAKQKAVLGMTFTVYGDRAAIRPDENGVYPAGKATIEIINVGETSSTARVTSASRGNPVVKGDVLANAVYDPTKVYKFVVFGNFDANRDGIASPLEAQEVRSMIESWGGEIVESLTGDCDFLVLGDRPVVPARPADAAPLEVVQNFVRQQKEVQRYDDLADQARKTSVPVLNENRLYTLTGITPARPTR
ncbi:MAG: hypothetical protein PSX37_12440, partial [bacterium]|nr:hypothetical protein [bacterium]